MNTEELELEPYVKDALKDFEENLLRPHLAHDIQPQFLERKSDSGVLYYLMLVCRSCKLLLAVAPVTEDQINECGVYFLKKRIKERTFF